MAWIGAAASLVGSAIASDSASDAGSVQAGGANAGAQYQKQMYDQTRKDLSGYRGAGNQATNYLSALLGLSPTGYLSDQYRQIANSNGASLSDDWTANPEDAWGLAKSGMVDTSSFGSLLRPFSAADLKSNLAPNYDFMLGQGQTATNNLANLSGGVISGNALKGINDYTQNYAQNAYQQAYNNYNTNQSNIFNRLSSIAGLGENASAQTGTIGSNTANGVSSALQNAGTATAGGIVGSGNALSQGINNAASWYKLGNISNGSGSTPQYAYGASDSTGLYYPE